MSLHAMKWAAKQRVGCGVAKAVLMCLADYHNAETGQCFPSIQTIMNYTEYSDRTIQKKLFRLTTLGLIRITPRSGTSNAFHLQFEAGTARQQEVEPTPEPPNVVHPTPERGTGDPRTSDGVTGINGNITSPSNARAKPKQLMPDDWQPDPDVAAQLASSFPHLEISHEADQFRDYWLARGEPRADWQAAFRNWVRKSAQSASRPTQLRTPYPTRGERIAELNRQRISAFLSDGDPLEAEPPRPLAIGDYRSR